MRLPTSEQKQTALIRQLEEELRIAHMQRNPDAELQSHLDALYAEKDHMTKEIFLLRETIKVGHYQMVRLIELHTLRT